MAITIRKTIPKTSTFGGYSTLADGDVTITLLGVESFTGHSKKSLMKVGLPKSPNKWKSNLTDVFDYTVIDLMKGTDEIVMKCYIEDDEATTAWEKVWQLRAMCVSGGPLTSLIMDNITYSSSTVTAYLEDISWTKNADDTGVLNELAGDGVSRIELSLSFFIGAAR